MYKIAYNYLTLNYYKMKKIILIPILYISIFKNANSQTVPVTDTLAYLQTIVTNKANYIGHPFSTLANSLQIQIKSFFPFASLPYDKTKETSTDFSFYFPLNVDELYLTYPYLVIYWQPFLNTNQSNIIQQTNDNKWRCVSVPFFRSIQN